MIAIIAGAKIFQDAMDLRTLMRLTENGRLGKQPVHLRVQSNLFH